MTSSSAPGPSSRAGWTLAGVPLPTTRRSPERRARALSGLPPKPRTDMTRWMRLLVTPWTWVTVVLLNIYGICLYMTWRTMSADRQAGDQVVPGIDWETISHCARLAAPTALVWSLVFIAFDRVRPLKPVMWLLAFGWGSCVAIWTSLVLNTWAATMMNVTTGAGDPTAQARPAVFSAPFVEESMKACILFLLAILARNRIVSKLQAVCLAGLSAIGFAFTENIVYYARVMMYGSMTSGTGDVEAALNQMVMLRGVITSYGHPTFTMCTGIGLAIALRTRSKLVRVLAPATGFLAAAFGHMYFNGSSVSGGGSSTRYYVQFAVIVGGILLFLVRNLFVELRRVRTRLGDYVQMGWLPESDVDNYGTLRRRVWLLLVGLRRGPRTFLATLRMMRAQTELAYLRDSVVRGIVDEAGIEREGELLDQIAALRGLALSEARGLKLAINWSALAFWRRFGRRRAVAPAIAYRELTH